MGATSRRKGARRELELAALCGGQRVPLSGAAGGAFAQDVLLPNGWRAQCKARADGWKRLYADLEGADVLRVRADRRAWLAVLPLARLLELLDTAAGHRAAGR
jgi:hypothetical protein